MTTSKLKIIACISMLVDHIGAIFYEDLILFRIIGRLAFPIFAFLIANGYFHTKNIKKYLIRLGIFAIISEVPFDLAFHNTLFYFNSQNVFFTLFLGLLAITLYDKYTHRLMGLFYLILIMLSAVFLKTDYGMLGILMIFSFYIYKNEFYKQTIAVILCNMLIVLLALWSSGIYLLNTVQMFSILSLMFLYAYNGSAGKNLKYLFYFFYPTHLLLIYFIEFF